MNKVLLVGRLTRDPEMRTTNSGIAVTRFTLACDNSFSNRNGERSAEFINCVVWERNAANVAKYCTKGSLVSAEGRITTRSYDAQDGTKRYTTEVVCDNVTFLNSKGSSNTGGFSNDSYQPQDNAPMMETADLSEDPFKSFGEEITLSSDDLPF